MLALKLSLILGLCIWRVCSKFDDVFQINHWWTLQSSLTVHSNLCKGLQFDGLDMLCAGLFGLRMKPTFEICWQLFASRTAFKSILRRRAKVCEHCVLRRLKYEVRAYFECSALSTIRCKSSLPQYAKSYALKMRVFGQSGPNPLLFYFWNHNIVVRIRCFTYRKARQCTDMSRVIIVGCEWRVSECTAMKSGNNLHGS